MTQPDTRTEAMWTCEVGPADRKALPDGSDFPMRQAVRAAFRELTGSDPEHLSSGWGRDAALAAPGDEALRDALEDMVRQFGSWSDSVGGIGTGGLSALEDAFNALGWEDPHPLPDRRCDEPSCMKDATMGWPTRPGGTGLNGGYRRTCWDHSDRGKAARAALASPPTAPATEDE